jgi:hypothetical protein
MRYSDETLSFWVTVAKLFKGRGLSFFRGFKGEGLNYSRDVVPTECKINFAVPSDPVIQKEMKRFLVEVGQPGIINTSLDMFASNHAGKDVKLSVDGKKITTGFTDKYGDEDISGYEGHPTLIERQERHKVEMKQVQQLIEEVQSLMAEGADVSALEYKATKESVLLIISNLSVRINELREFIVSRKQYLEKLMRQVEVDD